jgi:hypothetical protein
LKRKKKERGVALGHQPPPFWPKGWPLGRKNKIKNKKLISFGLWGWPNHPQGPQGKNPSIFFSCHWVVEPLPFFFSFFSFLI